MMIGRSSIHTLFRTVLALLVNGLCGPLAGQLPSCDSLGAYISVVPDTNAYGRVLSVVLPPSASPLGATTWYFDDGSFQASSGGQLVHQFPGAGSYPVCAELMVVDNLFQDTCSLSLCELVSLPEQGCPGVSPEFSVILQGDTVHLIDQTSLGGGAALLGLTWDLGDGMVAYGPTPSHLYTAPGPFQICLSVGALDSLQQPCTSSVCHWFYNGPVDPPCEDLVEASFEWTVLPGGDVVLWNTSQTSGLPGVASWDLGDGSQAQGPLVLHEYAGPGIFETCLHVSVSGPLLTTSCMLTTCSWIDLSGALGLGAVPQEQALTATPNPARDAVTVHPPASSGPGMLTIHDPLGRVVLSTGLPAQGGRIGLADVPAGIHLLTWASGERRMTLRLVVSGGP